MAKAFKCDRCGQFYNFLSKPERRYFIEDGESYRNFVDLCPDCYEYFVNWLQNEEEMEQLIGSGELYPGEFESRHYEFEDCDNIKGERVIRCREEEDGSSGT